MVDQHGHPLSHAAKKLKKNNENLHLDQPISVLAYHAQGSNGWSLSQNALGERLVWTCHQAIKVQTHVAYTDNQLHTYIHSYSHFFCQTCFSIQKSKHHLGTPYAARRDPPAMMS